MVDLVSQYEKIKPEIDKAVLDVIASSAFINGPEVKSFQAELEKYLELAKADPERMRANEIDVLVTQLQQARQ